MSLSDSDHPIRILLVDDSDLVREGLAALLARRPQIVVVAEGRNGREAVALFRQHQPDVMLIDLRMPEMDGPTAIRDITAEFPQARIIVLTAFAGEEDAGLQAGAKAVLFKGAPREELLTAIRTVSAAPSP